MVLKLPTLIGLQKLAAMKRPEVPALLRLHAKACLRAELLVLQLAGQRLNATELLLAILLSQELQLLGPLLLQALTP